MAFRCSECGLDFAQLERGSRAATLVTFIVAALLIGLALLVDEWLRPPLWVMALVFVPLTITLVLGAIRLFKTLLLMARYERSQEQKEQSR